MKNLTHNYALRIRQVSNYCMLNTASASFCYLFITRLRYIFYICQSLLLNIHFACVGGVKDSTLNVNKTVIECVIN